MPINSPSGGAALPGPLSRFRRIMSILQHRICGYKAHVFDYTAPVRGDLFHSPAGELLWFEVSQEIYASPFVAVTQPRWSLAAGCSGDSIPQIRQLKPATGGASVAQAEINPPFPGLSFWFQSSAQCTPPRVLSDKCVHTQMTRDASQGPSSHIIKCDS